MPASPINPILIKRHAPSRVYDTTRQRYVALEQLRDGATKRWRLSCKTPNLVLILRAFYCPDRCCVVRLRHA